VFPASTPAGRLNESDGLIDMSHHLAYLSSSPAAPGQFDPWEKSLAQSEFHVLHAQNVNQVVFYKKSYPLVGVIVDMRQDLNERMKLLRKVAAAPPIDSMPLFGALDDEPGEIETIKLAEAGLTGILTPHTPPSFLLHQLKLYQRLRELMLYEQTAMDVKKLALQTRSLIHEMSQPLSALQGRLQLLAARCADNDPKKVAYKDLVELVMEATKYLRELQDLHHKFS
jgi:signal transduction histidine kinase